MGTLFIVSTPIGNMGDITYRAIETLKRADMIACEDTRYSKRLLSFYKIDRPLTSYFEHNKIKKTDYLMKLLAEGRDVALISDAGTPGISDPGYKIINMAIEQCVKIEVIPGPSAAITALVVSGLPTDKFVFEGFLPNKKTARIKQFKKLAGDDRTVIFYESCHRIQKALEDIREVFGDINIVCARELTKKFEEVKRGLVSEIYSYFSGSKPRGEFVVLFNLKTQNDNREARQG